MSFGWGEIPGIVSFLLPMYFNSIRRQFLQPHLESGAFLTLVFLKIIPLIPPLRAAYVALEPSLPQPNSACYLGLLVVED